MKSRGRRQGAEFPQLKPVDFRVSLEQLLFLPYVSEVPLHMSIYATLIAQIEDICSEFLGAV
jgi:hypothetical protein